MLTSIHVSGKMALSRRAESNPQICTHSYLKYEFTNTFLNILYSSWNKQHPVMSMTWWRNSKVRQSMSYKTTDNQCCLLSWWWLTFRKCNMTHSEMLNPQPTYKISVPRTGLIHSVREFVICFLHNDADNDIQLLHVYHPRLRNTSTKLWINFMVF